MTINLKSVLVSSIRAVAVFIVLDLILEYFAGAVFGISAKEEFKNVSFGPRFLIINFLFLFLEMALMISVYAIIRPRFSSRIKAALVTSGIFLIYTLLFTTHFVNFGMLSIQMFVMFTLFCLIELPAAILVGTLSYSEG